MPQLDFNFYLSQSTWLFIIFIIFHMYMKSYIYPYFYEYYFLTNKNFFKSTYSSNISYFSN